MYLYSITINIDEDVRYHWLEWMKAYFIPELLSGRLFTKHRFLEMVEDEKSEGTTYSLQLWMNSREDFETYARDLLEQHQMEMYQRYPNKFVEFRTLLKSVD